MINFAVVDLYLEEMNIKGSEVCKIAKNTRGRYGKVKVKLLLCLT